MYKTSDDLRFKKNRKALQRAYIDLVTENKTLSISIKEIAARANVNRMTFYSHYDEPIDILREFVDEMVDELMASQQRIEDIEQSLFALLDDATELMQKELDFFILVSSSRDFDYCRSQFRRAFKKLFYEALSKRPDMDMTQHAITVDFLASGTTFIYLDWLAGEYGNMDQEDLIRSLNDLIQKFH